MIKSCVKNHLKDVVDISGIIYREMQNLHFSIQNKCAGTQVESKCVQLRMKRYSPYTITDRLVQSYITRDAGINTNLFWETVENLNSPCSRPFEKKTFHVEKFISQPVLEVSNL